MIVDLAEEDLGYEFLSPNWVLKQPLIFTRAQLLWISKLTIGGAYLNGSDTWFYQHKGARTGGTAIRLVVHGNRQNRVRILGMKAQSHCSQPLHGALFYRPPGGADDSTIRLYFDLDKPNSEPRILKGMQGLGGNYFSQKTISLKQGEDIVFQIVADTQKHYCEFRLALDVLTDGIHETVVADNKGQPWRVTATYDKKYHDGSSYMDFTRYGTFYVSGNGALDGKEPLHWRRWDPQKYANDPRFWKN